VTCIFQALGPYLARYSGEAEQELHVAIGAWKRLDLVHPVTIAAVVAVLVAWAAKCGLRAGLRSLTGAFIACGAAYAAVVWPGLAASVAAAASAVWGTILLGGAARMWRKTTRVVCVLTCLSALGNLIVAVALLGWPPFLGVETDMPAYSCIVAGMGLGLIGMGFRVNRYSEPTRMPDPPACRTPYPLAVALVSFDAAAVLLAAFLVGVRILGETERFAGCWLIAALVVPLVGLLVALIRTIIYLANRFSPHARCEPFGGLSWVGLALAAWAIALTNAPDPIVVAEAWLFMGFGVLFAVGMLVQALLEWGSLARFDHGAADDASGCSRALGVRQT
jgi:hypothetical protein